jgi:hypothetical protein
MKKNPDEALLRKLGAQVRQATEVVSAVAADTGDMNLIANAGVAAAANVLRKHDVCSCPYLTWFLSNVFWAVATNGIANETDEEYDRRMAVALLKCARDIEANPARYDKEIADRDAERAQWARRREVQGAA